MSSNLTQFGSIDGLDAASGLRFFGGHAPRYLQALQTFAALYRNGLPMDDAGVGASGLEQALHSLAGASVVLGATALGSLAQRAEAQLQGAAVPCRGALDDTADVRRALAALVQQLQDRLPPA